MDMTDYYDLIVQAGRVPYKVTFGDDYVCECVCSIPGCSCHTEHNCDMGTGGRKVVPLVEANAWSSHSKLAQRDGYHLPVFDVDMPPDVVAPIAAGGLAEYLQDKYGLTDTAQQHITTCFDNAPMEWVPSTTPGHFHVYVEHPYRWEDYLERLKLLADLKIVEDGYYRASKTKGATFVRMPWLAELGPELGPPKPEPEKVPVINAGELKWPESVTWWGDSGIRSRPYDFSGGSTSMDRGIKYQEAFKKISESFQSLKSLPWDWEAPESKTLNMENFIIAEQRLARADKELGVYRTTEA